MARNGSGTQTTPNTFVAGADITAASHNQNWADNAAEMTNSVAADGQTSMTGPLKASNGTAAAPSVTFASDTDTGFFRKAANTIGIAIGGAEIGSLDSTGLTLASGQGVPIGTLFPYAGSAAPTGYLLCFGQAVSRTTYAALFAVVSTTYGAGDASTTFNLPDLRGRAVAGKDDMGGSVASRLTSTYFGTSAASLGAVGGSESHTLTTNEIPAHSHGVTDAGHDHPYTAPQTVSAAGSGSAGAQGQSSTTGSATTGITIDNAGGGAAHAVVQPTFILNFIIKI